MSRRWSRYTRSHDYDTLDEYHMDFADPGGISSLRAANRHNRRTLPCPTCGEPDRLTPADRAAGYQCNACADRTDGGW